MGGGQLTAQGYEANGKPKGAFGNLLDAQKTWKESSLKLNKKAVETSQAAEQKEVSGYLNLRIEAIRQEIKDLEAQLPSTKAFLPEVLDQDGIPIAADDLKKDPGKSLSRGSR